MNNQECIEHLQRLKMGINIINAFALDEDKDKIDLEALDYAISKLNKKEHSEEYKKGYQYGYRVATRKKQSNLVDISLIPQIGEWYHIEGDDNTFVCPFCENHTYTEDDYIPKFCMECGAKLSVERGEEE